MSRKRRSVFDDVKNTLSLLNAYNLLIYYNSPIFENRENKQWVTWPNHQPGRYNCESFFGKIEQYRKILETEAFTCLLFDASIVRIAYGFDGEKLTNHNLLWWPSPFQITEEDLQLGGVLEIFDLYASEKNWHDGIRMRSPVRFDFDSASSADDHPASHVHLQDPACRIHVDRPMSFNRFINFIFKNFYIDVYNKYKFWGDLRDTSFDCDASRQPSDNFLGWRN